MKHIKILLLSGAFLIGFAITSFAQKELPEIIVTAVKYKYLSAVTNKELPQPVRLLERRAAEFNIKNSEYYDDDYDEYSISFYIPQGYILATYDKDGKILRTAEKYKDVALPKTVAQAVANRFPGWSVSEDTYLVTFHEANGAVKTWKILLKNGDRRLRVKINEQGEFLK